MKMSKSEAWLRRWCSRNRASVIIETDGDGFYNAHAYTPGINVYIDSGDGATHSAAVKSLVAALRRNRQPKGGRR